MNRRLPFWTALPLLIATLGCATGGHRVEPIARDVPLPTSTPQAEGMDPAVFASISQQIADAGRHKLHSFLVLRHGRVVFEEYYNGYTRDTPHDLRSATKSITSLLLGIAIDRAVVTDVAAPAAQYLAAAYPDRRLSPAITLRHLLTMSSGLDCDDRDRRTRGQEDRMYRSRDWVDYFLALDQVDTPGERTRYCTGGVVALGAVINQAAAQPVDVFAEQHLFAPLGIANYRWARFDRDAQVDTGGHLLLTPQGLARIGLLVLGDGVWNGRRIVSERWIRESTAVHGAVDQNPYGYLWWIDEVPYGSVTVRVITARGNGGQVLFIVPDHDLVTVATAGYFNDQRSAVPYSIFYGAVLPQVLEL